MAFLPVVPRRPLLALRAVLVALVLFAASGVQAQVPRATEPRAEERDLAYEGPVLPPGREREVLALLRPFVPGGPVADGWSLANVAIRRDRIIVEFRRDGAVRGVMRLQHPSTARPGDVPTAHLAVGFEGEVPEALRRRLLAVVQGNDHVSLWAVPRGVGDVAVPASAATRGAFDGITLSLLLVAFLLAAVRRHTREGPRWLGPAVLGVTGLGMVLRLALSPEAPMNAWPYSRVVPLAAAVYTGPCLSWLTRALGRELRLVDLVFAVDLGLAALTPAALFVHARALLRDWRPALAAALLLATLPAHLRFSRSDVEFLQSLLLSSLTFVALYGALDDADRRWRLASVLALPALCLGTYLPRPENLAFFPLDLAALAVAAGRATVSRRRVALVALLLAAPAALAARVSLLARYRTELGDGLSARTLTTARETLFSRFNTVLNPVVTPPWIPLLAVLGCALLWRRGERRRAAFLGAWLAVFFVVHSYVRPHEVAMQARYHLHLATPLVLLAAVALPWLASRSRWLLAGALALLLAGPFTHRSFVRDTDFYEMREFAFVRRVARTVPEGCAVLEFRGVPDPAHPGHHFDSRWQRFGARIARGSVGSSWRVVTADTLAPGDRVERLAPAAREFLEAPPPCARVYLGLSCVAQRPAGTPLAPVCEAITRYGNLIPVAEETITGRVYDAMNLGHRRDRHTGLWGALDLLPPGTPVRLGLYRYTRVRAPASAP